MEGTREGELTQFVSNHVLGDINRNKLLPVVNSESQTNEIRQNRGPTRPSLDWLTILSLARNSHLFNEVIVAKRSFFN